MTRPPLSTILAPVDTTADARAAGAPVSLLVSALGIAQIVSWGTLFYAIGVLGRAMQRDLGLTSLFVFGSFTVGLLVSGVLAPMAGRLVDARGGRVVLSAGSVLGALAMAILAAAPNAAVMVAGWLVAGAAMAACLYDPAFATLSQHAGERYRWSVTALTLWGGFASTAFWPLSQLLMEAFGWRATFAIYAAMNALLCLPIHLLLVPRRPRGGEAAVPREREEIPARRDPRLKWINAALAIATFIFGVVAVHMIGLLTAAGLTEAQAVALSMLVGPMQVAGRVVEMAFARRVHAVAVGYVSFVLMLAALALLAGVHGMGLVAVAFVVAYGCGNGLLTVVRGTAPAELFGREGLGALLGHLSRFASYAKALAPAAWSALLAVGLARHAAIGVLLAIGVGATASYWRAVRR
ncbi:MAG TPA: MFS transporter [Usitatibacter sp.]|nr:MFS transporter [Usitatibacter sp.]